MFLVATACILIGRWPELIFMSGHIGLRFGPNRTAKWAISQPKMGRFAVRNGPFCNVL